MTLPLIPAWHIALVCALLTALRLYHWWRSRDAVLLILVPGIVWMGVVYTAIELNWFNLAVLELRPAVVRGALLALLLMMVLYFWTEQRRDRA